MAEAGAVSQEVAQQTFETKMNEFTAQIRELEYKGQAIYFLNAFWNEIGDVDALDHQNKVAVKKVKIVERTGVRYEETPMKWPQQIYEWVQLMNKLSGDSKGSDMHALDETGGARFLEIDGRAKTVLARRSMLKDVDIDSDNHMSLFEWLLACEQLFDTTKTAFNSKMSIQQRFHELMSRPQGTNPALKKAQAALDAVMKIIQDLKDKIAKNEAILDDPDSGLVSKRKAKNTIAQIQSNFPNTELNRALITAEAALRKVQKGGADGEAGVMPGANWYLSYEMELAKAYKPQAKER